MTSRKLTVLSLMLALTALVSLSTSKAEAAPRDPVCLFCPSYCPENLETFCEARGCLNPGPAFCAHDTKCGPYPDNLAVYCAEET